MSEDEKAKAKDPGYSLVKLPGTRFCGRCQRWVPNEIEIHFCVKAPRKIGYEWREFVRTGGGKLTPNQEGPKLGKLIERFEAEEE